MNSSHQHPGSSVRIKMLLPALLLTLLPLLPVQAAPHLLSPARYEVIDLTAQAHEQGNVLEVSGRIRNHSQRTLRGYAIIYLLDGHQRVVHAVEAQVNDNLPFKHGQAGHFGVTVSVGTNNHLRTVSVEFVPQEVSAL
ncbi:MAG: hypothetical protein AB7T15_01090 [Desulfuromonas sp.]|nr:hypothetical protein [Desulfuromonas thiophila]